MKGRKMKMNKEEFLKNWNDACIKYMIYSMNSSKNDTDEWKKNKAKAKAKYDKLDEEYLELMGEEFFGCKNVE
jgi:hypothetical protein